MGNTSSQSESEGLYKSYIDTQFDTIRQQQNQITQLINMQTNNNNNHELNKLKTLNTQQKIKYIQNLKKIKQAQLQNKNKPVLDVPKIKNKLNPYTILNVDKTYDEITLKKAYLKAAMISHPDRGGSETNFQKVSIAYAILKKKLEQKQHNDHNTLKTNFKNNTNNTQYLKTQQKFDIDVFNKIYDENKLEDIYDRGYGGWIKNDTTVKTKPKLFNGKFNKDMFNYEFEKYKQTSKNSKDVIIRNPHENISYKGSDAIVELGKKNVSNFSGNAGGLGYRDLKDAYENSTLINVNNVNLSSRTNDIRQLKDSRSNIKYTMNKKDLQQLHLDNINKEKQEKQRLQRLIESDRKINLNYQKIHNRLIK